MLPRRLGESLAAARRTWGQNAGSPVGAYSYMGLSDAASWSKLPEASLRWEREEHQVLTEPDLVGARVAQVESICSEACQRQRALDKAATTAAAGDGSADNVILVTHGDLLNCLTPGFDFDPDVGRYCAEPCGWFICSGHRALAAYEGETRPLASVPRVLALDGINAL